MVPAKCGVGKVNATICAQMLIDPDKSEAIAFSSVAEGLVRIMAFGDMVIGSSKIPKPCADYSANPPPWPLKWKGRRLAIFAVF